MKRFKLSILVLLVAVLSACAHVGKATKSSPSLLSFLGLAEVPDWYVTSRYTYPDSKWIENDFGLRVHYRDKGEGATIVLIHGEGTSLHVWEQWIENLSQDYRVVALDLPGSGLTGAPHCVDDTQYTCAENLSEDYIQHTLTYFLEDLRLRNFTLVGHSYGGYLAAQYALANPTRVNKLILMAPLAHQQNVPDTLHYLTDADTHLLATYVQPATIPTKMAHERYAETDQLTDAALERYIHLSQTEGALRANVLQMQLVRTLMEQGTLTNFSALDSDTLVIWGERDAWSDIAHASRWTDEVPGSVLVKYPFSGNLLMEEEPELALPDVTAFIAGDPLPSLDGGGSEGSFTIQDAVESLDQESLFGPPPAEE